MRIVHWALFCILAATSVHCSSGANQTGSTTADADAGAGTGGDASYLASIPSTCAGQGPQVTALYCSENEFLIVCDVNGAQPPAPCKRAVPEGGYCCPIPSFRVTISSLLVCRGPEGGSMKDTLRFVFSQSMEGEGVNVALYPLESTERTTTGRKTAPAFLTDPAPTGTSFTARADTLELPGSTTPNGVALSLESITLSGAMIMKDLVVKAVIKQPSSSFYTGGCVLLQGSQDDAFTVTDDAVTFGGESAVLSQMTPPNER